MPSDTQQTTVWRLALVLAVSCLGLLFVSFGVGAVSSGANSPLDSWAVDLGESSDQHLNPDTLESESGLGGLDERLVSEIRQRARSGALNLTQDDYERAREQLNNNQLDALTERYDDSTDAESSRSATLSRAQESIASYTQTVAAFWELHEQYEQLTVHRWDGAEMIELPDAGDTTRLPGSGRSSRLQSPETEGSFRAAIRALVANLTEQARAVDEIAPTVVENYEALSGTFGGEYTETIEAVKDSRERIFDAKEAVLDAQYTETNISASVVSANPSAVEPVSIRGRLTTGDGTALAGERVPLLVANESYVATTNETGWFNLSYRPYSMLRNETALTVRYAPGSNSTYLSSETTVSIAVDPVEPTLETFLWTREVQATDRISLSGRLTGENQTLPDVPYVVTLGESVVASGVTERGGRINVEFAVPETVSTGEQDLVVQVPYENRVLRSTNATTSLTVEPTPTTISLNVTADEGQTVRVSGSLATADGTPAANQSVYLTVAQREARTVTTDGDGQFEETIPVPDSVSSAGEDAVAVPVTAVYEGTGTSFETAREERTTTISIEDLTRRDGTDPGLRDRFGSIGDASPGVNEDGDPSFSLIAVGVLLFVVVTGGAGFLLYRRRQQAPDEETVDGSSGETTAPTNERVTLDLETARELLAAGQTDAAIRTGYASVRTHLGDESAQTHWEFYREYSDRLGEEADQLLRDVTEAYERVAFAGEHPDADAADSVLDSIESLLGRRDALPDGGSESVGD